MDEKKNQQQQKHIINKRADAKHDSERDQTWLAGLPVRHPSGFHCLAQGRSNRDASASVAAAAAETLCLRVVAADAPSGPGDDGCALHKAPRRRRSVPEIAA